MKLNTFTPFLRQRSHQVEQLLAKLVMIKSIETEHGTTADLGYCLLAKKENWLKGTTTFTVVEPGNKVIARDVELMRAVEIIIMKHW